jgi:hypothetical protein
MRCSLLGPLVFELPLRGWTLGLTDDGADADRNTCIKERQPDRLVRVTFRAQVADVVHVPPCLPLGVDRWVSGLEPHELGARSSRGSSLVSPGHVGRDEFGLRIVGRLRQCSLGPALVRLWSDFCANPVRSRAALGPPAARPGSPVVRLRSALGPGCVRTRSMRAAGPCAGR